MTAIRHIGLEELLLEAKMSVDGDCLLQLTMNGVANLKPQTRNILGHPYRFALKEVPGEIELSMNFRLINVPRCVPIYVGFPVVVQGHQVSGVDTQNLMRTSGTLNLIAYFNCTNNKVFCDLCSLSNIRRAS